MAVFDVPDGCMCYPDDRTQALCLHHVNKANPNGAMLLHEDLTVGAEFTADWMRGGGLCTS